MKWQKEMTENNVDLTKNWQICVIFGSSKEVFMYYSYLVFNKTSILRPSNWCPKYLTLVSTSLEKAVLVSLLWIKAGSHYAALR